MDGMEMPCEQEEREKSDISTLTEDLSTKNDCTVIAEGLAEVAVTNSKNVFYNPVQEFNRDVSVAVLNLFAEDHLCKVQEKANAEDLPKYQIEAGKKHEDGIKILEALSASGLRGIRYAREVAGVKEIVANDLSASAVASIRNNVARNGVEHLVTPSHSDAALLMYQHRNKTDRFHAVDLDPYGCPSQFLDAAVQCVSEGGILLVTCTDMAVLAGNSPETCYVKYGSVSLRSRACHEMALRIVLQCIEAHANRYGRYIQPLLSMSIDFYVRIVVQVFTSPSKCKFTTSKLAMVYQCTGCETTTLQPLGICRKTERGGTKFSLPTGPNVQENCQHCSHRHHFGGPIWAGPLHSQPFLKRLASWPGLERLGTAKRLQGVLAVLEEELLDVPLYYTIDRLCSLIHVETIPMLTFRSALLNAGYQVSLSHASRTSIKTNAPASVVWAVMRAWESQHPAKKDRLASGSPAARILTQKDTPGVVINLAPHPDANPPSRRFGLSRFQENPTPNWGPGTKAQTRVASSDTQEKSRRNQGKRTRAELSHSSDDAGQKHAKNIDRDQVAI